MNLIDNKTLRRILRQLNSWCECNGYAVTSIYDDCHGMSFQQLVYYLFGVVKTFAENTVNIGDNFNELYEFVKNYFDNLDLLKEVEIIINKMYENGELAAILGTYTHHNINYPMTGDYHVVTQDAYYNSWPTMIRLEDNSLVLFYMKSNKHNEPWKSIAYKKSTDRGFTWSDEIILLQGESGINGQQTYGAIETSPGIILLLTIDENNVAYQYNFNIETGELDKVYTFPNKGILFKPFKNNGIIYSFRSEFDNEKYYCKLYVLESGVWTWHEVSSQPLEGNVLWNNVPYEVEGIVAGNKIVGLGRNITGTHGGYYISADLSELDVWYNSSAGFSFGNNCNFAVTTNNSNDVGIVWVSRTSNTIYGMVVDVNIIQDNCLYLLKPTILGYTGPLTGSANTGYPSLVYNDRSEYIFAYYTINNTNIPTDQNTNTSIVTQWFTRNAVIPPTEPGEFIKNSGFKIISNGVIPNFVIDNPSNLNISLVNTLRNKLGINIRGTGTVSIYQKVNVYRGIYTALWRLQAEGNCTAKDMYGRVLGNVTSYRAFSVPYYIDKTMNIGLELDINGSVTIDIFSLRNGLSNTSIGEITAGDYVYEYRRYGRCSAGKNVISFSGNIQSNCNLNFRSNTTQNVVTITKDDGTTESVTATVKTGYGYGLITFNASGTGTYVIYDCLLYPV